LSAGQLTDRLLERDRQSGEASLRPVLVPALVQPATDRQRLADGEIWIERRVLGDEADARQSLAALTRRKAEHLDRAGARREQADGQLQQSRLTCSIGPDEADHAAGGYLERAVAKRPVLPVALPEPVRRERVHATRSSAASRSVLLTKPTMLASSSPAACASSSQRRRPRRNRAWVPGGGAASESTTNVPSPGRASTRPSY